MATIKKEQRDFMDWEFGVFFHFGIRTFYEGHDDWDMKPMPPEGFNPTDFDADSWIKTVKEAGARYAVLVCKHHDGFANWPSKYTDYSVANTPWRDGKGDVVREYVDACRKYGVKVGLYYSPAQFGSSDMISREYDDYFINQISELLTNYGKIDYLWFDGCGSENHKYDTERIIAAIRALQPEILIFNMWDPDTRWVGNESGFAHSPNKITVAETDFSINKDIKDLLAEPRFLPVECDFRMRLRNWFYSDSDEHTVKSVDELLGIYYHSVGRGANLLVNIGPDRRGRLPEKDAANLLEMGRIIKERFSAPLETKVEEKERELIFTMTQQLVNHVVLSEELDADCEIGEFEIKIYPYSYGYPVTVYRGTTIGHKAICQFPTVRTAKVSVSFDSPKRVSGALYYAKV
ncbi:MAG: alpha-L-fucosidase [Clostridia bacterium]|nr:alpha-L-fucosidase [Clostridia bacterium]